MSIKSLIIFFIALGTLSLEAQETFPSNGAPYRPHTTFVFTNANLVTDPSAGYIKSGTLVIRDGLVIAAGEKIQVPADAIVFDLAGKFIYPSFIDPYGTYGVSTLAYDRKPHPGPQMESTQNGAYGWNMAIRSGVNAGTLFRHNADAAEDYAKAGFGAVQTFNRDGIVRGSGAVVLLNHLARENESMLNARSGAFYSLDKGSSTQDYPTSLTGAIALLRQTFYDSKWYRDNKNKKDLNLTLEDFIALQTLPAFFEGNDKYNDLRIAQLSKEFSVPFIVKAGGNEYQRIQEIKQTNLKYILPLNFPDAIDVEDPYEAENVSLSEMKHWEMAPTNPAAFEKNGIAFAFTASDLKDKKELLKNVRKAVRYGLSEKTALAALTSVPAGFLGLQNKLGALKPGMIANFIIVNKSIFEDDAVVYENWTAGQRNMYIDGAQTDLRGNYLLKINSKTYTVSFTGDLAKPRANIQSDTLKRPFNYNLNQHNFNFSFSFDSVISVRGAGLYETSGKKTEGKAQLFDGSWTRFVMTWTSSADTAKTEKPERKNPPVIGKVFYPFTAFGHTVAESAAGFSEDFKKSLKPYNGILIKNASVWTNEHDSVLRNQDVLVLGNKIEKIGKALSAPADVLIIDGTGKHLSPGIIDEHSHIALSGGVNEAAEASSAEVRMGDVINPEDINIYRQLAGGVTSSQLLHGSANPIGGQSCLVKLRWGMGPEAMKFEGAAPFIKFALGENVKQSNWGDLNTVRFPQSRMGVEQVYNDFFTRATEYDKAIKTAAAGKGIAPRRDLELEALAEILNNRRFITCHSYVQSEINMLMHVADSFGFKVNTFTHILEGYKVADKMKAHGVSASTFSDWWAYKNEVMEAIPYNAAILTRMGVNTAINSDDAEMARRLNQEAAKCIRYGGLTETEALKLVTLNPAKMLHVDDKVGSIRPGKSADLVLWSANPLSVYAVAEKTIIDGQIYFDRNEDKKMQEEVRIERARLTAKMLAEKQKGAPVTKPKVKRGQLYHCNTIEGVSEEITGQR